MASASSVAQDVSEIIHTVSYETTVEKYENQVHNKDLLDLQNLKKTYDDELIHEIATVLQKLDSGASEQRVTEDAKKVLFSKGEISMNNGDDSTNINRTINATRDKYFSQSNEQCCLFQ